MFGKRILDDWDEITADLAELIAIPSVRSEPAEGEPYGKGPAEALRWFERRAEEMGLLVHDVDHRAAHAEYGAGQSYGGVLAHLDVVPAGDGWKTDPFRLTKKDGVFYGRGVEDDKSYALIALYCLRALKNAGVTGKRRMRVIVGIDEECGMSDMEAYFAQQPLPDMAFTPDVSYTVCNREKGILQLELRAPRAQGDLYLDGGGAVNAVAGTAQARFTGSGLMKWEQKAAACQCPVTVREENGALCFTARGTASHAMEPERGVNAATHLLALLEGKRMDPVCRFVARHIGTKWDGAGLGISQSDEPSGPLTLNVGYLHCTGAAACAGIDIRYPVTADGNAILKAVREKAEAAGVEVAVLHHQAPIYLPEEHPLIRLLVSVYEEVTGRPAVVYATGGGTYARALAGRGVGFGGAFPGREGYGHTNREQVLEEDLKLHAQICLEAMYRMMTAG